MEKQRGFKNVIIGVLLVAVFCLSVAFATFSQILSIEGTATVKSATSNWNIRFSAVEAINTSGYAVGTPSSSSTSSQESITFTCDLMAPNDSCTLAGIISNAGTINATYTGVTLKVGNDTLSSTSYEDDDVEIALTLPAWTADQTVLEQNDSGSFSLKVTAKEDASFETEKSYSITATFNFEQADK